MVNIQKKKKKKKKKKRILIRITQFFSDLQYIIKKLLITIYLINKK